MSSVRAAAHNNARWCDLMARLHGTPGRFDPDAWTSPRRTPPYYPDAVTLVPGASPAAVLARIDTGPACSVKDSFADLDLAPAGFRVLFEARWLYRAPGAPVGQPAEPSAGELGWRPVRDRAELARWERAWGDDQPGLFRPGLLDDPGVLVLGGYAGDTVVAGSVANRTGDVVGLSNVYAVSGELDTVWPGCLGAVAAHFPGLAVVGYEHGAALRSACRYGFVPVGPLRVWLRADRPVS